MTRRYDPQVRNPVSYVVQVVSLTNVRTEASKNFPGFGSAKTYAERLAPRLKGWRLPSSWSITEAGDEAVAVEVVYKTPWSNDKVVWSVPVPAIPVTEAAALPVAAAA